MIAATTILVGAGAGYYISRTVADETGWYQRWFLTTATLLFLIVPFTLIVSNGAYDVEVSIIAGLLFVGIALLALRASNVLLISLATTALALIGGIGAWQILLVALIPTTGYLYPRVPHKQFLWFLLVPTIIIAWTLLA